MLIAEKVGGLYEIGWYSGTESTLRNAGDGLASYDKDASYESSSDDAALHVPGFQSVHQDGVHATFCDGQSRLLSRRIDKSVLRMLTNRKDGQLVGDF